MSDKHRNPQFLSRNDICRPVDGGEMTVQLCAVKPPLPCIVILVHGVNDVGEAYENQDTGLCAGLNDRLGRTDLHPHEWKTHEFMISDADGRVLTKTCSVTDQTCVGEVNRSPVIPFYWGYKPVDHAAFIADQQRYREELRKKRSDADLPYDTYQQDDARIIRNHNNANIDNLNNWLDPASAKGGGTFANATTCIPDMFGPGAAGKIIAIIGKLMSRTESFNLNNKDWSHPIYQNPHRIYQAYAARRLADLIIAIRQNPETETDTINIVAHSQGTLITMLANMWVKAEGLAPADCAVLNHSPYSLESRVLEDTLPGNQQSSAGRQKTLANFCKLMAANPRYQADNPAHDAGYIQHITDTGCLALDGQDNTRWNDPRYSRNNFGMVYNYFCPNDQVVSMSPIQGFGWRGIPDNYCSAMGNNLRQRVFCKDQKAGEKTGYHFVMPSRQPDDPKDTGYHYSDVTISGLPLPEPFDFKLMAQEQENGEERYKAKLAGNDIAIAKAAMKAERFITEKIEIPNSPAFYGTRGNNSPLSEKQISELREKLTSEGKKQEVVDGRVIGNPPGYISYRRRMTEDELQKAVDMSIAYSQHSSIVASIEVSRKSTAYDLAIGQNNAFENKKFWDKLLLRADWRRPENPIETEWKYYQEGILPDALKKMMNKPEFGENPMPTGEFGVVNDYGPRQRVQPGTKRDMENKLVDVLQWDMPKPLV